MAFSKPVDMGKSRKELEPAPTKMLEESGPQYSYGHRITLDQDDLAKLDKDADLNVGDEVTLLVTAKVLSINHRADHDSEHHSLELQITHICTEEEDEDEGDGARHERFYGDDSNDEIAESDNKELAHKVQSL